MATYRRSIGRIFDVVFLYSRTLMKPQTFHRAVAVWKHLAHPNIVPILGATLDTPQLVSDWIPGGNFTEYVTAHPDADRQALVRVSLVAFYV